MQEYVTRRHAAPLEIQPKFNGFAFDYKFSVVESSRGQRTNEPTKQLHKEYYLVTKMGLVANIGGTMGLFIGFSFSGSLIWIIDMALRGGVLCRKCYSTENQAGRKAT